MTTAIPVASVSRMSGKKERQVALRNDREVAVFPLITSRNHEMGTVLRTIKYEDVVTSSSTPRGSRSKRTT